MFDESFITPEIEARYEKLEDEQKEKFFKYFSDKVPDKLEELGKTKEDLNDKDLDNVFLELIEKAFTFVGEKKDDWRGLPLLW